MLMVLCKFQVALTNHFDKTNQIDRVCVKQFYTRIDQEKDTILMDERRIREIIMLWFKVEFLSRYKYNFLQKIDKARESSNKVIKIIIKKIILQKKEKKSTDVKDKSQKDGSQKNEGDESQNDKKRTLSNKVIANDNSTEPERPTSLIFAYLQKFFFKITDLT